jgi:hypothetical protein
MQIIYNISTNTTHLRDFLTRSNDSIVGRISASVHFSSNVCSLENPLIMFRERLLAHLRNFFQQLFLRKQMRSVQVEFDTNNVLNSYVTPVQMIGLGVGGIIGEWD